MQTFLWKELLEILIQNVIFFIMVPNPVKYIVGNDPYGIK